MKVVALFLVVAFAVASNASNCDFRCSTEDPTKVEWNSLTATCPAGQICNKECKMVKYAYPMCATPKELCDYDCNEKGQVVINQNAFDCPLNMKCNPIERNYFCDKTCVPSKCPNEHTYNCIDDEQVNIGGLIISCPADTKCNKNKIYPCAFCLNVSGEVSSVRGWLTDAPTN